MLSEKTNSNSTGSDIFSVDEIFFRIKKYKYKIISTTALLTVFVVIYLLIIPNRYTAKATLLPSGEEKEGLGQYASIASLVGINLSSGGSTEKLYPEIITSNRILYKLYDRKWKYSEFDTLTTLDVIFGLKARADSPDLQLEKKQMLVKYLKDNVIAVDVNKKTGFIAISVSMDNDPVFAAEFLSRLLSELEIFNKVYRKSKSTEEKIFLEKRLKEVFDDMTNAEDKVRYFEENHRNWAQSPELKLEWQRLSRNVQVSTTMWIELKKQFELTKLSVEREKITLNILDIPDTPTKKDSPIRWMIATGGLIGSFILSLLFFLIKDDLFSFSNHYISLYKSIKH